MQSEFDDQIAELRAQRDDLVEDNTRIARHEIMHQDKQWKELRINSSLLAKNQEEAVIKSLKSKLRHAEEMILEMNNQRDNMYRS